MITYTVKPGDNLMRIARRYYGSVIQYTLIAEANNINDPNKIEVGQVLKLPMAGRHFIFPLAIKETSYYKFGTLYNENSRWAGKPHPGVDFHERKGAMVFPIADGIVRIVSYDETGYGHYVVLEHRLLNDTCVWSLYAHMIFSIPRVGDRVAIDEAIGREGDSGAAGTAHLHLEIKKTLELGLYRILTTDNLNDYFYDPYIFIKDNRFLPME